MYRLIILSVLFTVACGRAPVTYSTSSLVLTGSVSPIHTIGFRSAAQFLWTLIPDAHAAVGSGSPTMLETIFYRFWASEKDDCSSLTLIQDYGDFGTRKDLTFNPVLFGGVPSGEKYHCIALEMDDQVTFRPDSKALSSWQSICTDWAMEYTADLYRSDDSLAWKSPTGQTVSARGTQLKPVSDRIFIFASTSPVRVQNGPSSAASGQVFLLSTTLQPPTSLVFYADFQDRVSGEGSLCHVKNPAFGFR